MSDLESTVEELPTEQLARTIIKKKGSLKALKMSTSLIRILPHGLKLEKFVTRDVPHKYQVRQRI